jgi:hypothetical protein
VTERGDLAAGVRDRSEAPEAAARSVLEKDALDGVLRAVREHLIAGRLKESHNANPVL